MQLSKKEMWRKEQNNLKKGLATPLPADNFGARLMRQQGWVDGAGLGAHGTGQTENVPLWHAGWLSGGKKARDTTRPPRFVRASTNQKARDTTRPSYSAGWASSDTWDSWADSGAWGVGDGPWCREVQQSWASSDTWDSWADSGAWGVGLQPSSAKDDAEEDVAEEDVAIAEEDVAARALDRRIAHSEINEPPEEDVAEEDFAEENAKKRKKKKSSNPGAHKRWLQEHTQPDDYTSEYPKWSFWSGKLDWSGFAKSSWDFLDDLHCEAEEKGEACTATLDIGGWLYEITIDPNMEDDDYPEACGYQVAMHSNSKQKRRLISRSY